ncbi:thiolase family protein [Azospirillum sp. TSO22-1]|uniref:thiolase family protein n=1 Tax=Azospirillum sp. TSO22-1 TaxID=716789 RepID=UPI000D6116E6|nr:thiolase family protein [Azospirillum sp. TSO22-1]PWC52544.1 hypothetical protein TSO221_13915 [Azospirillum sp. TSO22-1]
MTIVHIAGSAVLPFGRYPARDVVSLGAEAARAALADSGLRPADVGFGVFANALAGRLFGASTLGQNVLAEVGVAGIPVLNVENACTSGSTAVHLACTAIRAGEAEVALVVGAEKMCVPQLGLINSGETEVDTLLGLVTPASFALRAQRHMHEFGTRPEQLAAVAVKNRAHAGRNPAAMFRQPVTLEEVLAAPMIATPLTRLQCCPIADGAAALVLVSERVARRLGATVRVAASVLTTGTYETAPELARWETDRRAAGLAYEQAGLGPGDLHVVECHDAFTIAELLHYEGLGLCPPGEGGAYVEGGAAALGGRTPVNPSGGLLSRGHPVGATGVAQVVEIAQHLQGRAGERQVPGARVGLAHCMGGDKDGDTKSCTIIILRT